MKKKELEEKINELQSQIADLKRENKYLNDRITSLEGQMVGIRNRNYPFNPYQPDYPYTPYFLDQKSDKTTKSPVQELFEYMKENTPKRTTTNKC